MGSGPRHLCWHPSSEYVFVLNELNNTVTTCGWNGETGALVQRGTERVLLDVEGRPSNRGGAAEIVASADGERVYCTVRLGRDAAPMQSFAAAPFGVEYNVVATLEVEAAGALRLLANTACGGSFPWGCALSKLEGSDAEILLVQNQHTRWDGDGSGSGPGQLVAFFCGAQGATLVDTGARQSIDDLMCLAVARL
eukprot:SAG11_NODE_1333_length_5179_cov_3.502953_3_plen_195_part_00